MTLSNHPAPNSLHVCIRSQLARTSNLFARAWAAWQNDHTQQADYDGPSVTVVWSPPSSPPSPPSLPPDDPRASLAQPDSPVMGRARVGSF